MHITIKGQGTADMSVSLRQAVRKRRSPFGRR